MVYSVPEIVKCYNFTVLQTTNNYQSGRCSVMCVKHSWRSTQLSLFNIYVSNALYGLCTMAIDEAFLKTIL